MTDGLIELTVTEQVVEVSPTVEEVTVEKTEQVVEIGGPAHPQTHVLGGADHTDLLVTIGSGLNVNFASGRARIDQTVYEIASGSLALAASATTYVFVNSSGVVAANTTGFPANSIPLATAVTSGSAVTSVTDKRALFYEDTAAGGGAATLGDVLTKMANRPDWCGGHGPGSTAAEGHWGAWRAASLTGSNTLVSLGGGRAIRYTSVSGGQTGIIGPGAAGAWTRPAFKPLLLWKFAFDETTDIRALIGMGNGTLFGIVSTDTPGFTGISYVGLQYSTARGDLNFQIACGDGTDDALIDTGIPVDVADHYLLIDFASPTAVTVTLLDAAGAQQFQATLTTLLPATTTDLRYVFGFLGLNSVPVKTLVEYFGYGANGVLR